MDPYVGQEILGQFRIIERIGQGGMGSVYKAEQPSMDRLVAVKILHPRLAARPDLVTRFKREARAMSRLTHPNTVRVYLYGEMDQGGALYIVMEFLDGADLMRVLRRQGPSDVRRAARIMVQVCGALEEAHNQAIVHRDLKPENIILTTQGGIPDFPKVLDFGLAKIRDLPTHQVGGPILTQEGMVFGTPEFMSPEQAQGHELDRRTDIYSLGIIMYEMLTGKLPFKVQNPVEYVAHHIRTPPIPIHERAPERNFDPRVWTIIARAIQKKPEHRYQTAVEFAESLAQLADGDGSALRLTPGLAIPVLSTPPVAPAPASPKPASAPPKPAPAPEVKTVRIVTPAPVQARSKPAEAPKPAPAEEEPGPRAEERPAGPSRTLVYVLIALIGVLILALILALTMRSPPPLPPDGVRPAPGGAAAP
jgi:serine/threonine-protein kinase